MTPITINTGHTNLVPGTVMLTWGSSALLDPIDGMLSGSGGYGSVDYVTGKIVFTPTVGLNNGDIVYFSAYKKAGQGNAPINGNYPLQLDANYIATIQLPTNPSRGDVALYNFTITPPNADNLIPPDYISYLPRTNFYSGNAPLTDDGNGSWHNAVNQDGSSRPVLGQINYATGLATLDTKVLVAKTLFRHFVITTINGTFGQPFNVYATSESPPYLERDNLTWRAEGTQSVVASVVQGSAPTHIDAAPYTVIIYPPSITEVVPKTWVVDVATPITLTGVNLGAVTAVSVGGIACTSVVATHTKVTALATVTSTGTKFVETTPALAYVELTPRVSITSAPPNPLSPPVISSITPNTGATTGGYLITIAGTYLADTKVEMGGITCTVVSSSNTVLVVTAPPADQPGIKYLAVKNSGGDSAVAFTYTGAALGLYPKITSIEPNFGLTTGGCLIRMRGTNLANAIATIGGLTCNTDVSYATELHVVSPAGTEGSQPVVVTNSVGSTTVANGFTYTALGIPGQPTISTITPAIGALAGGYLVTIKGTNLTLATVTIGGTSCTPVSSSNTSLVVTAPAGTAGTKAVVVTNSYASTTVANGFAYAATSPANYPTVSTVTPNTGVLAGGYSVTIAGTNLANSTATIGGASCTGVSSSGTSLVVTVPAGTLGGKALVVTNSYGSITVPNGFFYIESSANNKPQIYSISPNTGAIAGGYPVTILGDNLTLATATIGGVSCTIVSASITSLVVTAPAGTVGTKAVVVTNGDGSATLVNGFVYWDMTYPIITSIVPNSGLVTGTNGIVISGSGMEGATVIIGGTACTTVSSTSTAVTVNLPASDSGKKDVIVTNVAGQTVWTLGFTVKLLTPLLIEEEFTLSLNDPAVSVSPTGLVALDTRKLVNGFAGVLKPGSTIEANCGYTTTNYTDEAVTAPMPDLQFKLAWASGAMVAESFRATLGTRTYYDVGGKMFYDINPTTGAGTEAGTIDTATKTVVLTDWPTVANTLTVTGRSELIPDTVLAAFAIFRTPAAPVAVGSFSFRVTIVVAKEVTANGVTTVEITDHLLEGDADNVGVISGSVDVGGGRVISCHGKFDYQVGVANVYFGEWVIAANYTAAAWYSADAIRDDGKILYPGTAKLNTLLYNCVTYTSLPLDSSIIGLDPVRLPADGRIPIFKDGQLILVHNTQVIAENTLSPTQVIDCGRVRLYRVAITDANGVALSPEQYTLDRTLGTVTMKPTLDLTGLTAPYSVAHTVADLSVISDADLSGRLNLTKAISHTYPADTSYVSGVLYAGTLQARITKLFEQSTWTSVWQNTLIGSQPLAQFNDAQYPIQLTNSGAYPDRILIKFTSSTEFQVIGENLGLIGLGNTGEDCEPMNSLTRVPYFTIPYLGWGNPPPAPSSWATGNCLRFNVISAAYPIDLIRAIQPSEPTGLDSDSVELLLLGNVDQ